MEYVITNGERYVTQLERNGAYTTTTEPLTAKHFTSVKNAGNVLKRNAGKFGKGFQIRMIDNINACDTDNIESKPCAEPCELPFDITDKAGEISKVVELVGRRKDYLVNELTMVELELSDIAHAAEFYELNASQGYKLYKMLHDARVRRRKIKDELNLCTTFMGCSIKGIDNVCRQAEGYKSRAYAPRVNKELFDV